MGISELKLRVIDADGMHAVTFWVETPDRVDEPTPERFAEPPRAALRRETEEQVPAMTREQALAVTPGTAKLMRRRAR